MCTSSLTSVCGFLSLHRDFSSGYNLPGGIMNALSGTLPSSMGSLSSLVTLCALLHAPPLTKSDNLRICFRACSLATGNQLSGSIPSSFGSLTTLQQL